MRFVSSLIVAVLVLFAVDPAMASEAAGAAAEAAVGWPHGLAAIGMGFASALGAFSQSRAASAALEGISRNPGAAGQLFTPLLLSLALMESLVLFTFLYVFIKL